MILTKKILIDSPEYLAAVKIRTDVFVIEQSVPAELEIDQYEKSCEHFLTTVNDVSAATGRLRVKEQFIKFERIACLKNFRGTGIGRKLMEFMLDYALKNHTLLTPYMHSQVEAVPFYEKLGWVSFGDLFYEAGIAHRAMIYKLHN